ncbi:MAG: hypothetical protein K2X01_05220 [Cyanobacteria bacterium]|nr:hypothetical protein [Cyanobacteriota bacterium]
MTQPHPTIKNLKSLPSKKQQSFQTFRFLLPDTVSSQELAQVYQIRCRDCRVDFQPKSQYRLSPGPYVSEECQAQDLLIGKCSWCQQTTYAWIEVDALNTPLRYHAISPKKQRFWDARLKTDIQVYGEAGALFVQGSRQSFPWNFCKYIPVI